MGSDAVASADAGSDEGGCEAALRDLLVEPELLEYAMIYRS